MSDDLLKRLERAPVVPLVVPDDPESAIKTTQALVNGGLSVIEEVLRTPAVATASQAQNAWNMGLRSLKFFPASLAGGP